MFYDPTLWFSFTQPQFLFLFTFPIAIVQSSLFHSSFFHFFFGLPLFFRPMELQSIIFFIHLLPLLVLTCPYHSLSFCANIDIFIDIRIALSYLVGDSIRLHYLIASSSVSPNLRFISII